MTTPMDNVTPMQVRGLRNPNIATNGRGIGVSYSNVVLGGGVNQNTQPTPAQSAYRASYESNANRSGPAPYQGNLEFNARVKYDYNIVNNQGGSSNVHRAQPVLQQVGSQMISH